MKKILRQYHDVFREIELIGNRTRKVSIMQSRNRKTCRPKFTECIHYISKILLTRYTFHLTKKVIYNFIGVKDMAWLLKTFTALTEGLGPV